jgi:hypothetical protein
MQPGSLHSAYVGTVFVIAFLCAAPAAALPIGLNAIDDDRWTEIPRRWSTRLDNAGIDDRVVLKVSAPPSVRDLDDRFRIASLREPAETRPQPVSVPEPGTLFLAGIGAVVSLRRGLRRR